MPNKCSTCKKQAVYFRINEGRYYCKSCFTRNIEKKVKATIAKNNLIQPGDKIAIAYSGGKDSGNILFMFHKIFKNNPKVKLVAITINEGIAGYRDAMLDGIKEFCKQLGVEHHIASYKGEFHTTIDALAKETTDSMCGTCGVFRRYLLNNTARKVGATKLVTGHNLDDEAQSIMMNMLKGDLLRLARTGPKPTIKGHTKFIQRIKPMIMIPEKESALYAMLNDIKAYFAECPYAERNALRMETRDFLNKLEERSPGIKYSIVASAEKVVPFIEKSFRNQKINNCRECGEPTSGEICKVCQTIEKIGI